MRHTWTEWSLITAAVKCRARLSLRDRFLSRACTLVSSWVQEGSVEGSSATEGTGCPWSGQIPHLWDGCWARMPGRLIRRTKRLPITPRTRGGAHTAVGIRPLPGPVLLEHCPSFTNPTTRRGHQIHCLFWTLFSPLDTLFLLFLLNKSLSEAWRHTPTVSVYSVYCYNNELKNDRV